jgi:hypothetical protein
VLDVPERVNLDVGTIFAIITLNAATAGTGGPCRASDSNISG